MTDQEKSPSQRLLELLHGFWFSKAIQVATTLGIPDALRDGPKSTEALAHITETHAPSLHRLLRALATIGVFAEVEPSVFMNTELSTYLRSDQPGSLSHLARMMSAPWYWRSWEEMAFSIRTGQPVFNQLWGMDSWRYLKEHAEARQVFDAAIHNVSELFNRAVATAYDFSSIHRLVDVGGGHGGLLVMLLAAYPNMQGILFDQPAVIEESGKLIAQAGLSHRCKVVGGDMFASLPPGGDAYLLKEIIHGWDDERAIQILRTCRQAMQPDGRVLVADMVIKPGGKETYFSKFMDLKLLLDFSGRERTVDEFQRLFEASGLKLVNVLSTASPFMIFEGIAG